MKIARRGEFEKEKFTTVTGDFVRMKRMAAFAFDTPLKFNMEPENQPLEEEIPFGFHHAFSGSMLDSGSVCRKSLQNLFSNILGLANVMRCLR